MADLAFSVAANSLWIVGLAILLAAFSYHYDRAQRRQHSLRQQLAEPSFAIAGWLAFVLIASGLAATSTRIWETVIWILFAILSLANATSAWRAGSYNAENIEHHGN
ncbi:MAG TPA: hypothetical protein VK879_10775 [Candidatus Sulfomarinibacteraceae bacterium]|nr:hypothetical protein [Candidatus Sulfomarinibacteraceae bacterium]